jgi:cell fate (sporulation/competence/biofilm development) regulator YlbF (YheA/YmcA/DUF963 family)
MKLEEYMEIQERLGKLLNESNCKYEEFRKNAEELKVKGQLAPSIEALNFAEGQMKVSSAILDAKMIVLGVAEKSL